MSDKPSSEKPSNSEADRVAAAIVESVQIRSLSGAGETIPVQHGDPIPGGIRPREGTSHSPVTETSGPKAASTQSASVEGSPAADSE
jgi:hypothetical protein